MPRWPARPLAERFWEKVDRSGGPNACWPWLGAINKYGYGHFRMNGKVVRANRLALVLGDPEDVERPGGPIPGRDLEEGQTSRHSRECYESGVSKACCNVAHLTPGTHGDNLRDAYEYGERPREFAGTRRWLKPPEPLRRPKADS